MPPQTSVSVVVPVYDSEATLALLLERLEPVLRRETDLFEAILVNDGSRDSSWERICRLTCEKPWVRGINLMRNSGQHNAVLCGIRAAIFPIVVTIDDDLQHPPEEIPQLLNQLGDDFDVIYGAPLVEQHGLWRDLASKITKTALRSSMGNAVASDVSAFRALRTQLREAFRTYNAPFVSIDVLLTWGTSRFYAVKVRHDPRRIGKTNYTFRKLVIHAMNMMTGFSTWPLQVASLLGFAFTLFGLLVLCWVLGRYMVVGTSVPGFPFLASVIAIFSGAQMFALGVIGEYLARMHFQSMGRPAYTIRGLTGITGTTSTTEYPEMKANS